MNYDDEDYYSLWLTEIEEAASKAVGGALLITDERRDKGEDAEFLDVLREVIHTFFSDLEGDLDFRRAVEENLFPDAE